MNAVLLEVAQSDAEAYRLARHIDAWLLLALALLSASPASVPVAVGACAALRGNNRAMKVPLRSWYAAGAVLALVTLVGTGAVLLTVDHTDPWRALMFWLAATSIVLVPAALCAAAAQGQRRGALLQEAELLTSEQVRSFRAELERVERVASELGEVGGGADATHERTGRFTSQREQLMHGEASEAVRGLEHFMCVDGSALSRAVLGGTAALVSEVEALGVPELTRALHEHALCERGSTKLEALVRDERAVAAGLCEAHIVAIRLYTSSVGFRYFNDPMRDMVRFEKGQPHPLPVAMSFLSNGVRLLRLLYERGQQGPVGDPLRPFSPSKGSSKLFRGLRGLTLSDDFLVGHKGGTELAPMSCTSDWSVAVGFTLHTASGLPDATGDKLVLQLRVRNCVQFGAMIDFLSVNPSECEVLYPPLCFMQPTGRYQVAHSGPACRLTVVEVEPHV